MRLNRRSSSSSSSPSQHGLRFSKQCVIWSHPRLVNNCVIFIASFFAILINILSFYLSRSHSLTYSTSSSLTSHTTFLLPTFVQREQRAANQLRITLSNFSAQSHAYFLCPNCPVHKQAQSRNVPKVVALIELRNVAESLPSFLTAIERIVDSVVALDDHSNDETRAVLLERCLPSVPPASRCKLDALLVKSGGWVRQELLDRDLLLRAGRSVGGTHFVLLDYDERFVGTCVKSGSLRDAITGLSPGHSLFLPWIELWKNPAVHRVLSNDRDMNFLTRRQTVVFADDESFTNYSIESSRARSLGSHGASIHALRCPRSVCPQPPRYRGPNTPFLSNDRRVHQSPPSCAIVEARFMHIPNVILKAAWYQGLARILNADSSTTRGKMVDALFPAEAPYGDNTMRRRMAFGYSRSGITLTSTPVSWFSTRGAQEILSLRHVESWRARELVDWLERLGDSQFSDLRALQYFDLNQLRHATLRALFPFPNHPWQHVPRWKRGTLAITIGNQLGEDVLLQILGSFGEAVDVELFEVAANSDFITGFGHDFTHKSLNSNILGYEDWRLSVVNKVRMALSKSENRVGYVSAAGLSVENFALLVEFISKELDQFDVVFVFGTSSLDLKGRSNEKDYQRKLKFAMNASIMPGSHIRMLAVNSGSLGSYSAMTWLRYRIVGTVKSQRKRSESKELLILTERINEQLRKKYGNNKVVPVARMIFSLNVGRSGSKYLAGVFSSLGHWIRGLHEPRCAKNKCSGGGAIGMQHKPLKDTYRERRSVKIPMFEATIVEMGEEGVNDVVEMKSVGFGNCEAIIEQPINSIRAVIETNSRTGCLAGRLKDFVYTETNPNFKSWFYDVTLDIMPGRGYETNVIVLRKYHAAALKSLYETGYFTTRNGFNWMETGNGVNSQVDAIRSDDQMDAFDKIISYLFNAEAVTRSAIQRYSANTQFVEVRSEEIYSTAGTIKLLKRLGLSHSHFTTTTLELAGKRSDKYGAASSQVKRRIITSIDECERRIADYIASCVSLGIKNLPQNMTQLSRYPGFVYL